MCSLSAALLFTEAGAAGAGILATAGKAALEVAGAAGAAAGGLCSGGHGLGHRGRPQCGQSPDGLRGTLETWMCIVGLVEELHHASSVTWKASTRTFLMLKSLVPPAPHQHVPVLAGGDGHGVVPKVLTEALQAPLVVPFLQL